MAQLDKTPNQRQNHYLAGTGSRIVEVGSTGLEDAIKEIIQAELSDATIQGYLEDIGNWDASGAYTGTTITGTYAGQYHYDDDYYFLAVANDVWIRLPRVAGSSSYDLAADIHAATSKTPAVDADEFGFWDSVSGLLRKLTWANIKTTLASTFAALTGATFTGDVTIEKDSGVFTVIPEGGTPEIDGLSVNVSDLATTNSTTVRLNAEGTYYMELYAGNDEVKLFGGGQILEMIGHSHKVPASVTSVASSFTHYRDSYNAGKISAQDVDFTMNAPVGTPRDMETFTFNVRANTSGVEITWNAAFRSMGATLPAAALTANKWYKMIFMYESADSKWDLMSLAIEP